MRAGIDNICAKKVVARRYSGTQLTCDGDTSNVAQNRNEGVRNSTGYGNESVVSTGSNHCDLIDSIGVGDVHGFFMTAAKSLLVVLLISNHRLLTSPII